MIPTIPLDLTAAAAGTQLIAGRVLVCGVAARETTQTAGATFRLRDGSTTAGLSVIPVSLAAGESVRDFFGRWPVLYQRGVFYELVGGSVEGLVAVVAENVVGPQLFEAVVQGLFEVGERVG